MKKSIVLLLSLLCLAIAQSFPSNSGIVLTDIDGNTWDIDQMLDDGKHIVFVATGSG